jgi:hypothetical protein
MWLSTKRKRKEDESSSLSSSAPAKTKEAASTTTTSDALRAGSDWQSTLPLDWTRMHRSSDTGDNICCVDSDTCRHRGRIRPLSKERRANSRSVTTTTTTTTTTIHRNDDDDAVLADTSNNFHGRAIFCLHDDDPSWVQGYFIPRGSTKPWGMLAIQEEVDDCLACSTGGYRRLSLTVYHRSLSLNRHRQSSTKNNGPNNHTSDSIRTRNESSKNNSCKIDGVDWTGGDMITLFHPRYVDMEAERLLTVSIMMCRRVLSA